MLPINNNFSIGANRNLSQTQQRLSEIFEKLSSGKKINKASDDAAGLAIANRFAQQILGTSTAIRNSLDGVSLAQTADAAAASITDSVQRMRELAVQAGNGTLNSSDRRALQAEFSQLQEQVGDVISDTNFNGKAILSDEGAIQLQIGSEAGQTVDIATTDLQSKLTSDGFFEANISTAEGAQSALDSLSTSLDSISEVRSEFGASINRIESVVSGLEDKRVNLEAARSRIEDTDYAKQISELTKNLILREANLATQAQSNISSQQVLGLLRG